MRAMMLDAQYQRVYGCTTQGRRQAGTGVLASAARSLQPLGAIIRSNRPLSQLAGWRAGRGALACCMYAIVSESVRAAHAAAQRSGAWVLVACDDRTAEACAEVQRSGAGASCPVDCSGRQLPVSQRPIACLSQMRQAGVDADTVHVVGARQSAGCRLQAAGCWLAITG